MGSKTTKLTVESPTECYSSTYENCRNTKETNESIPATPFLTPEASHEEIREEYVDPKSPSEQIGRRSLEELSFAVLKLADLSIESLETDRPAIDPPLKHHLLFDVEPGSRNVNAQCWSPVIVRTSPEEQLPAIIRNKNLKRVKNVVEVCSEAMKSTDQCRAPLGLKNGEVENSNMDRLKVSDKPRKQVKVGSKIPVFKGKTVKVHCENILPRNRILNSSSSKKTQ